MKVAYLKLLVLGFVLLLMSQNTVLAQFSTNNKDGKKIMFAMGVGLSGGEMDRSEIYGGNIMLELRKPFWKIGQDYNLSLNITASALFGSKSEGGTSEFAFLPVFLPSITFNAFSQASKKNKNMLGGFLGVGALILPGSQKTTKNTDGTVTTKDGIFGPAILFGPRFRIGKTYMDMRIYGGFTTAESVYGGLNFMFTMGMNKKRNFNMQ